MAARFQNFQYFFRSIPIEIHLLELKMTENTLNDTRLEKQEHVDISSSEISFRVDDTSFPKAMRIMAENWTKFSDFKSGFATLGTLH